MKTLIFAFLIVPALALNSYGKSRMEYIKSDGSVLCINVDLQLNNNREWVSEDNSNLIATASIHNLVTQVLNRNFNHTDETVLNQIRETLMEKYKQVVVADVEISRRDPHYWNSFEYYARNTNKVTRQGIRNLKLFKFGNSSFKGFIRDEYTTLKDVDDRPLFLNFAIEWDKHNCTRVQMKEKVSELFHNLPSSSVQHLIHLMTNHFHADGVKNVTMKVANIHYKKISEHLLIPLNDEHGSMVYSE